MLEQAESLTSQGYLAQVRRLVVVLAALALVGLGLLTPAGATTRAATDVRTVSPVDATGAVKASYRITKNAGHGTCQVGSYQTGTAYR